MRQKKLTSEDLNISNKWYLERVRVKRMLHELGRRIEGMNDEHR